MQLSGEDMSNRGLGKSVSVLGFIRNARPRRDIAKGEGKTLWFLLGNSYVRLELMHLLSVVVGDFSFFFLLHAFAYWEKKNIARPIHSVIHREYIHFATCFRQRSEILAKTTRDDVHLTVVVTASSHVSFSRALSSRSRECSKKSKLARARVCVDAHRSSAIFATNYDKQIKYYTIRTFSRYGSRYRYALRKRKRDVSELCVGVITYMIKNHVASTEILIRASN